MTEDDYKVAFRNSAIKRAKWRGLVRNACIALGNAKLVRGHARRRQSQRVTPTPRRVSRPTPSPNLPFGRLCRIQ